MANHTSVDLQSNEFDAKSKLFMGSDEKSAILEKIDLTIWPVTAI